ncbi:general secretion pathway protein GspC [Leptospira perolatii]|uniref:General secretion pathway protein GspC n=1 Tax=Leptospira perolatii TaxID=2023191 RepID=A0A2M9ZIL2_9LEPT|nr:general secretion pathway protein GspC [Leptospira perolatii]PJZ68521.1 general secretion pathway protein GspC [Leptospira perolatii]PJZ71851.1 general secretion pathway protein GspC [Leptospira perolatii]
MNAFFIELRKNTFYALIPIVVLFSLSLAYLFRGLILAFLTPDVQTSNTSMQPRRVNNSMTISMTSYEEMVTGNLIRGSLAPPPGEGDLAAGAPPDTGEGEEMRITGTLSGHWSFARVTILEKGKAAAEEFATGETVGGYKIKVISLNHVVLEKGGASLKVEIGQTPGEARAKLGMGAAPTGPGAGGTSSDSVRKILSRQDVNRKLKDPTAIYKNARFGPFLENGQITGYKIYSIGNDHIFYALGAKSGDVIRRVNGMPLNETEKMLEIWNAVKTSDKVSVDVERNGKILTYEFIIRN